MCVRTDGRTEPKATAAIGSAAQRAADIERDRWARSMQVGDALRAPCSGSNATRKRGMRRAACNMAHCARHATYNMASSEACCDEMRAGTVPEQHGPGMLHGRCCNVLQYVAT